MKALLVLLFVLGGCKEVVVEPTVPTSPPVVEQPTVPPVTQPPVVVDPPVSQPPVVTQPPVVQPPVVVVPPVVTPPETPTVGKVVKLGVDAQTIEQAFNLVKTQPSGTILLERGKSYPLAASINFKHLAIKTIVWDAYGTGAKPVIKTGGKKLINKDGAPDFKKITIKNIVVDNEKNSGTCVFWVGAGDGDLLSAEFLSCGVVVQGYNGENPGAWRLEDVKVLDAYSSGGSHMQGLYASKLSSLTVLDSVFDHNGWRDEATMVNPPSGTPFVPTMYNHNLYLSECNNVTIKRNKIMNASSMGIKFRSDVAGGSKNIIVEDNYFLHGEIGIGIGGNVVGPDRFQNVKILNNVFEAIGATAPTKRNLAWGIGVDGDTDVVVQGNKFSAWPTFSNKWVVRTDMHVKNLTIDLPVTGTQKGSDGKVQYTLYGTAK